MKFSKLLAVWLFWPAVAVVMLGELGPSKDIPFHDVWDKALHFTAYFGLMGLAFVALGAGRAVPWRRAIWPALGLVVLGGVLEIIQGLVGRDMSFWDEVANTLGVCGGYLAGWAYVTLLGPGHLVEAGPAD